MSLGIWEFNATQGVNGDVVIVDNPRVEVRRESDGQLATIYEDVQGTTPLLNPFTAEANGTVRFYADESDLYQVKISKPPVAQTLRHQGVSITADLDALKGLVNVKAFGAVGDGETDDTDAFDAAAEALPDDFGTIIVPAGEYVVSSLSSNAKPVWFLLGARAIRARLPSTFPAFSSAPLPVTAWKFARSIPQATTSPSASWSARRTIPAGPATSSTAPSGSKPRSGRM